jgi:hypothetical protein
LTETAARDDIRPWSCGDDAIKGLDKGELVLLILIAGVVCGADRGETNCDVIVDVFVRKDGSGAMDMERRSRSNEGPNVGDDDVELFVLGVLEVNSSLGAVCEGDGRSVLEIPLFIASVGELRDNKF